MSKLYIDITKDRLYVELKNSKTRRSAQTVMYKVLHSLARLTAPLLTFTADEIWQCMTLLDGDDKTNVNFNTMPKFDKSLENKEIEEKWDKLFFIRDDITKALEVARTEKLIGKPLDAKVVISGEGKYFDFLKSMRGELNAVFIVSQTELSESAPASAENGGRKSISTDGEQTGLKITVSQADGEKCERCWTYSQELNGGICPSCAEILKNL
jgi:isoleucyl-tRNA synthetase